jgi:hypothetical protein
LLADIAERLNAIQQQHGANAVAVYLGNPWSFYATRLIIGGAFQDLINTDMRFSANPQDSASRVDVNCEVYGTIGP